MRDGDGIRSSVNAFGLEADLTSEALTTFVGIPRNAEKNRVEDEYSTSWEEHTLMFIICHVIFLGKY